MKRFILSMFLLAGFISGVAAQNRSINFEQTPEWKKIVKKAEKEKKLIFVDCYTSWCGPCKMLAKDVFTQDEVADYFNQTFVNTKYDMEKEADGVALKKQFAVRAFPTLVFVDPVTEKVVHRMVGAEDAVWFLSNSRLAVDPQNNLTGMIKRYEAGERTPEFLEKYLERLAAAYMKKEQGEVAEAYMNSLKGDQLATIGSWNLIGKYISDPLSEQLKYVMANRYKFYKLAGKEAIDCKLRDAINFKVGDLSRWQSGTGIPFDEDYNAKLVDYLRTIEYEGAPGALASLYAAAYIRKGDFRGMLDHIKEVLKYNLFRGGMEKFYFQQNMEGLTKCDDKALVEEGIKWIDQLVGSANDYFTKANLMNFKARLLKKNGDTLGADKAKMEEEKYSKEGEKKNGGRMTRAVRAN